MLSIIRRLLIGWLLDELGFGGDEAPVASEDVGAEAPTEPVGAGAPSEPVVGLDEQTVHAVVVTSDPA